MDIIEIILRSTSSGELQRLALNMMKEEFKEWKDYSYSGGCEGTNKTRKGTPDIWCRDQNDNLIYIQVTCDSTKGKMYEDTEKSVESLKELNKNKGATCVSYVSFDPQIEEYEKCKKLCEDNECNYILYKNQRISELLKTKYQVMKVLLPDDEANYIGRKIELTNHNYAEEINYIVINSEWCDHDDNKLVRIALIELARNAFEHGSASKVEIKMTQKRIWLKENGTEFNLLQFEGNYKNYGGGKFTLDQLIKDSSEISVCYTYDNGINEYQLIYMNTLEDKNIVELEFNKDCKLNIESVPRYKSVIQLKSHDKCESVEIFVKSDFIVLSEFGYAISQILIELKDKKEVMIRLDRSVEGYCLRFLQGLAMEYDNVKIVSECD